MADRIESTRVTFPAGATTGTSTVVAVVELPKGVGIVTAETPFHPLDHTWPDQPADIGSLTVDDHQVAVVDCLTGARHRDAEVMQFGADIDARRGDDDWDWYVVHVTNEPYDHCTGWVGEPATLTVDAERRARLSAAHTACHLMAFALNAELASRWRKQPATDSLGHPNFDTLAITSSRIDQAASSDTYRLGKSLRKKGFTVVATDDLPDLAACLPDLESALTERLGQWIAADADVRVDTHGPDVTAPREWVCHLPEGTATVACGGTHVRHLAELGQVQVSATLNADGTELTIVTTPTPQHPGG